MYTGPPDLLQQPLLLRPAALKMLVPVTAQLSAHFSEEKKSQKYINSWLRFLQQWKRGSHTLLAYEPTLTSQIYLRQRTGISFIDEGATANLPCDMNCDSELIFLWLHPLQHTPVIVLIYNYLNHSNIVKLWTVTC